MTTRKRILICGASGFLGKNLFDALSLRSDFDVFGTYWNNQYGRLSQTDSYQRMIRADLTNSAHMDSLFTTGFDVVIQTAANSSGSKDDIERPEVHVTPNVAINNWLIAATHKHGVKQFIFPSCTVMYGKRDQPWRENDLDLNQLQPDKGLPRAYFGGAWMKIYAEKQCEFFSQQGRTKFTAIRHSNIYGPFDRFDPDRSHVFAATIRKVADAPDGGKVVVWGQGKEVRDFLHVFDFVRFVELVIDKQDYSFGLYNLGSEEPVSISELVAKTIKISGKRLEIVYDPKGPSIGNKVSIDCFRARDKFDWRPRVSLDEGIISTLEWYNKNKFPKPN